MEFWGKSSMGIALSKTKKASTAQLSLGVSGSFATGLQEALPGRSQTCYHSHLVPSCLLSHLPLLSI